MSFELTKPYTNSLSSRDTDNPSSWWQRAATVVFHLARYLIAAFTTSAVLVIPPLVFISALASLAIILLIIVYVAFLFGAPIDGGILQLLFWLIAAPVSLVLSVVISTVSVLLLTAVYTLAGVLPLSLLVELVFWRFADRQPSFQKVLSRLAGFVMAGILLGVTIGSVGFLATQPEDLLSIGVLYIGAVLLSVYAVLLFGLILTLALLVKDGMRKGSTFVQGGDPCTTASVERQVA